MKNKVEEKEIDGFLVLPPPTKKEVTESHGKIGRAQKYPFQKIKTGSGLFLKGLTVSSISPLVHYYSKKHGKAGFHCRTTEYKGSKGVLVYKLRETNKEKQLAQAGAN